MAGYWPRSFFACLWTSTPSQSINTQKRTWPIYPAMFTSHLVNKRHIITFIEEALQISTATHRDTSCACSKRCSRWPSVLGSLTYIFCSQGMGTSPELAGCSLTRRLPVLKPKMLSRSLVGDWVRPTPMPCAREFRKCTGWMWKNKSWNRIKDIRRSEVNSSVYWAGWIKWEWTDLWDKARAKTFTFPSHPPINELFEWKLFEYVLDEDFSGLVLLCAFPITWKLFSKENAHSDFWKKKTFMKTPSRLKDIYALNTCHLEVLVKHHVVIAQGRMKERYSGVWQYNTLRKSG